MTENEAIEDFEMFCKGKILCVTGEALEMVRTAVKDAQQYRAIGTVEQLEWCKDASHWKELFKEKLEKYEAIGPVDEFKTLKEKSEPKKPIIHGLGQRYCPVCKCGGADHFYCARCGQKLG